MCIVDRGYAIVTEQQLIRIEQIRFIQHFVVLRTIPAYNASQGGLFGRITKTELENSWRSCHSFHSHDSMVVVWYATIVFGPASL